MIEDIRISINGTDVTRAVDEESFPEYLTSSVKGSGLFDFQSQPFTFKVFTTFIPFSIEREMNFILTRPSSGEVLMSGFIDEVQDMSETPEITAFPNAVRLSDVVAGTEKNLSDSAWVTGDAVPDDAEIIRDFHSSGSEHIRSLVTKLINQVNTEKGTTLVTTAASIPDRDGIAGRFFGNILIKIDQSPWWMKLLAPIGSLISWMTEDDLHIRKKGSIYYLVKRDFGIFKKLWIVAGGLLNVSPALSISRGWFFSSRKFGIHVPSSAITLFNWGRWTIPESDWRLPNIGVQIWVYRMAGGGVSEVATDSISVYPQFDFHPTSDEMNTNWGPIVSPNSSINITVRRVRSFLDEEGWQGDLAEIISMFDLDSRNTYVIVKAQKKKNDLSGSTLLLSFETAFDDYYEVHYRDKSVSDILKDLCVVSGRWWMLDSQNVLHMRQLDETLGVSTITDHEIMELDRKRQKAADPTVSVNRYKEDDQGKVQSWGIKLRDAEYDATLAHYKNEYGQEYIETNIVVNGAVAGLMTTNGYGRVIEVNRALAANLHRYRLEAY